ncbi:ATP-dependent DNA helicase RecG [Lentilactobacillus parafarraginis F0439]|uniref:ATP-dependent DNA helicase RecG n=1 Tax=Lentilactobacillus parafarraginis F0439 TaxID=797515 RepID=G9ZS51_9LACO|nr:ATP-dependent DNA helicase RecG [Lentilactobacillus parafarraginis]EHL95831.1 ATP-dependent DNA helicase RecG [Lentilactobacillus parafarraginis F0439]
MASLTDSVGVLKGVGQKRLVGLNKLGINTINDLLTYYPRRYDDLSIKDLATAADGQKVTVKGIIIAEPTVMFFGRKRSRLVFRIKIADNIYTVSFFNQPWLKKEVSANDEVIVFGTYNQARNTVQGMKILTARTANSFDSIYPANKEVKQATIKQLIKLAFDAYQPLLVDIVPASLRRRYRLESFHDTIKNIHFPESPKAAQRAFRTAKFMEFFLFAMKVQILKGAHRKTDPAAQIDYDPKVLDKFNAQLPFKLTSAQTKVVREILADLKRPIQMNRLLQGDVGSGKTVVAAIAILAAISAHKQAAIMAPTEILAEQHANSFASMFAGLNVNIVLLTGATSAAARRSMLPRIADGEVNLIVGTHALFQDDVHYANLGLAVIDEQHRFGVNQRQALRQKGTSTNMLAMTATPIPRTLAITMYGDMDVSVIDQLPTGRKPIKTTWIQSAKTDSAIGFVKKQLRQGNQVYVVTPLIEESEAVDMKNAVAIFERFRAIFEPDYKVGLLHGQMSNQEKDDAMVAFKNNQFQVMVATTVIEVGVDVANANTMLIFDADHFGLAQLHQLRGRVGRGSTQSYCILIADPKNEIGKQRMKAVASSTNGFFLSQKDLELRGQGDITGAKQSGMPDFKVADPVGDLNILTVANEEAQNITAEKDWKTKPENVQLAKYLQMNQTINYD